MMQALCVQLRSLPSRRTSKNVLESRQETIRSTRPRLTAYTLDPIFELAAQRPVSKSNVLYGFQTLSGFEMVRDFTRALSGTPQPIPPELADFQYTLSAECKLFLIWRAGSTIDVPIAPGDFVDVWVWGKLVCSASLLLWELD